MSSHACAGPTYHIRLLQLGRVMTLKNCCFCNPDAAQLFVVRMAFLAVVSNLYSHVAAAVVVVVVAVVAAAVVAVAVVSVAVLLLF